MSYWTLELMLSANVARSEDLDLPHFNVPNLYILLAIHIPVVI